MLGPNKRGRKEGTHLSSTREKQIKEDDLGIEGWSMGSVEWRPNTLEGMRRKDNVIPCWVLCRKKKSEGRGK